MEEIKDMLRAIQQNREDVKSITGWVKDIDKEMKSVWQRLNKIESKMQTTMTDIKINTAQIDSKLDSKIDLLNSKLDNLNRMVEIKEHYEDLAKEDTTKAQSKITQDYRFWIMAIIAIVSFVSGLIVSLLRPLL